MVDHPQGRDLLGSGRTASEGHRILSTIRRKTFGLALGHPRPSWRGVSGCAKTEISQGFAAIRPSFPLGSGRNGVASSKITGMLIEFRVANYRSIRDEQAPTMEARRAGADNDTRPRAVAGCSKKLLPVAAIYGANASGQSNVLAAFEAMRDAVVFSMYNWSPEKGVPHTPFAWGQGGTNRRPSRSRC